MTTNVSRCVDIVKVSFPQLAFPRKYNFREWNGGRKKKKSKTNGTGEGKEHKSFLGYDDGKNITTIDKLYYGALSDKFQL